jgi:ATP-dependent Clp protease ATP-binding subunit ClpC
MIDRTFHVFVRQHAVGVSVTLLGHPHLCAVAADAASARRDLAVVAGRLLRRGLLPLSSAPLAEARLRRVDITVRALQKGRILSVPMRFSVVTFAERKRTARTSALRVLIPRLELEGELDDVADLPVYVEEIVRHHLHLTPLARLLEVAYLGDETLETLLVSHAPAPETERKRKKEEKRPRAPMPPALGEACRRLDDEREAGLLARAYGRDVELGHVAALLNAQARSSVLLVGEPSAGKTCLVHELAHRAADPASPIAGLEIYSTSAGRVIAGMRYLGEWQDRLRRMVAELRQRPAVLHFDSLGELLSVGGEDDTLDLARFLLPAIEAGEVTVLVEATPDDLGRAERTHGPFLRALRAVTLPPLSPSVAREALAQVAARIAARQKVRFEPPAIDRAMDLAERFGAGVLPGAAADLLAAAAQAETAGRKSATRARPETIGARALTTAFCARTGYPPALVDPAVPLDPAALLARLRARVMGQDAAMELLAHLVVTLKTNLADPRKPLGSFLLLGPTGVGKTESALALADLLFGDDRRLARFDMAEYAAPGSAARLVDAATSRSTLAKRAREQPFGVVLLDEIEKADAGVLDLLLQVLGDGRLTDSAGHTVQFRNTVVVMTSNLGADTAGRAIGFGDGGAAGDEAHYRAAAAAFFRPELLNRFDQIVPYRPLGRDVIASLARRLLDAALAREGLGRRGVQVNYDDEVVERLAALGFDARLGARPLKRAVEQHVVVPIAELLAATARKPTAIALRVAPDGRIVAEPASRRPH